MTPRALAFAAVAFVIAVIAVALTAAPDSKALDARLGTTPVIVELFTSQGCSSCPPADAFLHTLSNDARLRGKVIPLAFHVDYWDRLGWRDPFSSRIATQRQMAYVRTLKVTGAYTPQIVVSGAKEMVGSNEHAVSAAIEAASKEQPSGSLRVTRDRVGDSVNITVQGDAARDGQDLIVALYEDGVTTNVGSGENGGRVIVNDGIVRHFIRVDVPHGAIDKRLTIPVEANWQKLGVAAFLQERTTLKIGAAADAPPS